MQSEGWLQRASLLRSEPDDILQIARRNGHWAGRRKVLGEACRGGDEQPFNYARMHNSKRESTIQRFASGGETPGESMHREGLADAFHGAHIEHTTVKTRGIDHLQNSLLNETQLKQQCKTCRSAGPKEHARCRLVDRE